MSGVHLTQRDQAVVDADEKFRNVKAQLDTAIDQSNASPALLETVLRARAQCDRAAALPMKIICADCGGEEELDGCSIYSVVAVARHLPDGLWEHVEYDKPRKLVICGHCGEQKDLRLHLHDKRYDADDPARDVGQHLARVAAENEQLKARVETLEVDLFEARRPVRVPLQLGELVSEEVQ